MAISNSLIRRLEFELAYVRKQYYRVTRRYLNFTAKRRAYYGKQICDVQTGNRIIRELIEAGNPFMAGRLGTVELACIVNYLKNQLTGEKFYQGKIKTPMKYNAGFFPCNDTMLDKFSRIILEDIQHLDVMAAWNVNMEDYVVSKYASPSVTLVELAAIFPLIENPWMKALKGKKVLVIHPYKDSIISQYAKRQQLFPNTEILPDFELEVIQAVQSVAGNWTAFPTWFDAYDSMCDDMAAKQFDIALIGAGAYGLPLAAFAKKMGKQAVHVGGSLQLLFGIKGKRWDGGDVDINFYNEHWVRPLPHEVPAGFDSVEGGCYW